MSLVYHVERLQGEGFVEGKGCCCASSTCCYKPSRTPTCAGLVASFFMKSSSMSACHMAQGTSCSHCLNRGYLRRPQTVHPLSTPSLLPAAGADSEDVDHAAVLSTFA